MCGNDNGAGQPVHLSSSSLISNFGFLMTSFYVQIFKPPARLGSCRGWFVLPFGNPKKIFLLTSLISLWANTLCLEYLWALIMKHDFLSHPKK